MILSMLKWLMFGFMMLLVGQIRLGRQTVGEHGLRSVSWVFEFGREKMVQSKFFGELASIIPFIKRFEKKEHTPISPRPAQRRSDARISADEFTSTERESLMRILR